MEAKLVIVGGKAQSTEFTLKLPTVIGRSRSADIPLNHPLISRQHCEIFESGGRLMVRDLGSLNGTFIGDNRITAEVRLAPGGLLSIGSFTFRAVYAAADDEESPDFTTDGETGDDDPTLQVHHDEAQTAHPSAGESGNFNMSWLSDGSGEADHLSAATEEAPESGANLMPPADGGDETSHETPDPSDNIDSPDTKPVANSPAGGKVETNERAPAEESKQAAAAGGEDDLDDFFRSLSEP